MNAQGRSQRPGTNASREESTARSALSLREEELRSPSFIRFGRAEEAAREAEQREAAKRAVARQAQLNAYEAEMERMRQASSVPVGSAIPNAEGNLRAASGDAYEQYGGYRGYAGASDYSGGSSAARASAAAAPRTVYPAPYAAAGAAAQPVTRDPGQQRLNRVGSTSAALRSGAVGSGGYGDSVSRGLPGGRSGYSAATRSVARPRARRRIPLLFFCLPLIAVMLGRTIAFGSSIEAMIRTNAQGNAALEQFIMDNHIELHAVLPGSAWSALSLLMICLFAGFAANVLAWHRSSKPMGALTVLCYAVAAFAAPWRQFAPTICFTLLPALLFSALSCYALAMAPPVKRSVSRSVKRPQRGTVSGGRFQ